MVIQCAWGEFNTDERYPERLDGGRFILFPKPKTNLDKCKRWIKACGRPHKQLNIEQINKHKAVCSKHFVGENGPTASYPDPIQADGSTSTQARSMPKTRETTPWLKRRKGKTPLDENTMMGVTYGYAFTISRIASTAVNCRNVGKKPSAS
ncbi:hypothetical protein KP79_PYT25042 [Mizuhopecten yessoensis]|uniref:THAP-type domain-containing protein n=1 Tax=Mizuhopecten yessoensis TaxID=6573 RepID=A0A210PYS5_MIZYE|nr:hypothetical protein KP79_PYT25042 [Mizuhopecten yessoensis]